MSILYSVLRNTPSFKNYVDKESSFLRKRGFKKVDDIFDDDSVDNTLSNLFVLESYRETRRNKLAFMCFLVELLGFMALMAFFSSWVFNTLPPLLWLPVLSLAFVFYFVMSAAHTNADDNDVAAHEFDSFLSTNDHQQNSMETWEERMHLYDHEYEDHLEEEDDDYFPEEDESMFVRDEGVLAQVTFRMKEWVGGMMNKRKGRTNS